MRRLRKLTGLFIVLATATSTLLASTPHYDCLCPDGSIRRFCFRSASGEESCCGVASCCSKESSSDEQPKPSCCGKQSKPKIKGTSFAGQSPRSKAVNEPSFRGTCCQRILAVPEAQASFRTPEVVDQTPFVLLAVADAEYLFPTTIQCQLIWQIHTLPPPTDLVTTLQRLVI